MDPILYNAVLEEMTKRQLPINEAACVGPARREKDLHDAALEYGCRMYLKGVEVGRA